MRIFGKMFIDKGKQIIIGFGKINHLNILSITITIISTILGIYWAQRCYIDVFVAIY